jgi:hypothetical protein
MNDILNNILPNFVKILLIVKSLPARLAAKPRAGKAG